MVLIPIIKDTSIEKVHCSLCGRNIICRKFYNDSPQLNWLESEWHIKRTEDDWICVMCWQDLMRPFYAETISEGSDGGCFY